MLPTYLHLDTLPTLLLLLHRWQRRAIAHFETTAFSFWIKREREEGGGEEELERKEKTVLNISTYAYGSEKKTPSPASVLLSVPFLVLG